MVLPTSGVKVHRLDDVEEMHNPLRGCQSVTYTVICATVLCCTNGMGVRINCVTCVLDEWYSAFMFLLFVLQESSVLFL